MSRRLQFWLNTRCLFRAVAARHWTKIAFFLRGLWRAVFGDSRPDAGRSLALLYARNAR